jgi:tetratricopeptide (TPR) repeat protein
VLASRNAAIDDFAETLISDAAASGKNISVAEMLEASERIALADVDSPAGNRAAILATIARLYYPLGAVERAGTLYQRALDAARASNDPSFEAMIGCDYALAAARIGKTEDSIKMIEERIARSSKDPEALATCFLDRAEIAADDNDPETLKYATQGLEAYRTLPQRLKVRELPFLAAIANGNRLNGRFRDAEQLLREILRQYAALGRGGGTDSNVARNSLAVLHVNAGALRQALAEYDEIIGAQKERGDASEASTTLLNNRARVLHLIGRLDAAGKDYEACASLAHDTKDSTVEGLCLLGLAAVAEERGDAEVARAYVARFDRLAELGPKNGTAVRRRALVVGRIDLDAGNLAEARKSFEAVATSKSKTPATVDALLGGAEVDILLKDSASAMQHAKAALELATSMQGDFPYSYRTGLGWLVLGRALAASGSPTEARGAFESALKHLSETVDTNHPALLQAQALIKSLS